jgi:hypothetical protein
MSPRSPSGPTETVRATKVLTQARDSVAGFLSAFETVRQARGARGNPTDEEQDLLRAALVFSAAGLDSVLKELIKGAIRALAASEPDVQQELETFVQRQLRGESDEPDAIGGRKFLARILVSAEPQDRLITEYVLELTGSSLQSPDQLMRAARALGVVPENAGIDVRLLREIFDVRNKIIHELDVNLERTAARRNQNSRRKPDMETWSEQLLEIAGNLVGAVNAKLNAAT